MLKILFGFLSVFSFVIANEYDKEKAILTRAPFVPPHITRKEPRNVVVRMTCLEENTLIANGVRFKYSKFCGEVPGPYIRVREGDNVEFYFTNLANSSISYSIEIYAAHGRENKSKTKIKPNQTTLIQFKALNSGLYIYRGTSKITKNNISKGMYGLIFVQPKYNYGRVDKEFYIMKSEIYTNKGGGNLFKNKKKNKRLFETKRKKSLHPRNLPKMKKQRKTKRIVAQRWKNVKFNKKNAINEKPTFVFFNGSHSRHVKFGKELNVRVGDTVRLYVGNAGPNLILSFHVMGEIFDKVHIEGGVGHNRHIQTVLIPPGGSAIVEFTIQQPGLYPFMDGSIFRSLNRGAIGYLLAKGQSDLDMYYSSNLNKRLYKFRKTPKDMHYFKKETKN